MSELRRLVEAWQKAKVKPLLDGGFISIDVACDAVAEYVADHLADLERKQYQRDEDVRTFKLIIDELAGIKDDQPSAQVARNLALSRLPDAQGRTLQDAMLEQMPRFDMDTVSKITTGIADGSLSLDLSEAVKFEIHAVPMQSPFRVGQRVRYKGTAEGLQGVEPYTVVVVSQRYVVIEDTAGELYTLHNNGLPDFEAVDG